MKLNGGYNVLLAGRPDRAITVMPEPKVLYMPLQSQRFAFSEVCVKDGQEVAIGDVLAKDPDNFAVPLLAPRTGTVRLNTCDNHIVLENVNVRQEPSHISEQELPHIAQEMGTAGIKRYKLLRLGAWQFFHDAYTGALPDPLGTPQAVIVSTLGLEPFVARGDAQIYGKLLNFTRGLEQLQSLLEYQPIYLVMPDITSIFASKVREQIRGYAWVKLIEVPLKYPYDNFNILARGFGLKKDAGPIWSVCTEGILAIDTALTSEKACTSRIISVGGPVVLSPMHVEVIPGYPMRDIIDMHVSDPDVAIINGGMLTGKSVDCETALGLDSECRGLTILDAHKQREFLGFVRPGWNRRSYSGCFLSLLRKDFPENLNTAMRGELRPCISCNFCAEVCPASIMPHLIHKYLYKDLLEEADEARVDLCVQCGLCSFVCPSKIELKEQFAKAMELIKQELRQPAEEIAS